MSEFRIEVDPLGPVQVPLTAMWGAQTQRAIDNFSISGYRPWPAFIWSMGVIKKCAALVNCELGLLHSDISAAIVEASQEVIDRKWDGEFVVDPFQAGAGTSHNMNLNEVIANRATLILGGKLGEYIVLPNDHVNLSQSTNDTIPTAIRLGCLWRLDELLFSVNRLANELEKKAQEFDGIVKSGRTHLQDAVPVRLGQEFGAYARAVGRDVIRIERATDGLRRLGIGGTATGTGLNAHHEYAHRMVGCLEMQTHLHLECSENLFESMQSCSDFTDFSASLRTLAVTLIRIANDIRLLASGPNSGIDEIRLPALQAGSSMMPGKVNPVMAEMLDMAMFHIIGCDTAITFAAQAGQLELNVMLPVIAYNLFEEMHLMIGSVNAFTQKCVTGIQANPQKASFWLENNAVIITALTPLIGYIASAELVKEAETRKITIRQLALEKAEKGTLIKYHTGSRITTEEVQSALGDLRRMTEGGLLTDIS